MEKVVVAEDLNQQALIYTALSLLYVSLDFFSSLTIIIIGITGRNLGEQVSCIFSRPPAVEPRQNRRTLSYQPVPQFCSLPTPGSPPEFPTHQPKTFFLKRHSCFILSLASIC